MGKVCRGWKAIATPDCESESEAAALHFNAAPLSRRLALSPPLEIDSREQISSSNVERKFNLNNKLNSDVLLQVGLFLEGDIREASQGVALTLLLFKFAENKIIKLL